MTADALRAALDELAVEWEATSPQTFVVSLPGERKLKTACVLQVGQGDTDGIGVHAFVVRRPDENHESVYRYLLERNLRLRGIAFCVDHLGDIHLVGRLPAGAVNTTELDQLLGAVLTASDESFNRILELGFASSIRREWDWRTSHGEPTVNLEAFKHLVEDRRPDGE